MNSRFTMPHVTRILETCLCVHDLAAARKFYTEVLGLAVFAEQTDRHLFFRVGDQMFLLFDPKESSKPLGAIPAHGTHGAGHVCFAIHQEEFDAWRAQLAAHNIPIESIHTW